jgi:hypothetical protein
MGAIWQAGNGPAADDQGNVYVMTGNGHFQSTKGLLPDLADSFVKLENKDGKLPLVDWYTPRSRDVLEACDLDLGASGPAIIQDSGKVLGAGKSGILYVLDKDSMGRDPPFDLPKEAGAWNGTPDCKVGQCFRVAENVHGQPDSKQACNMIGFPFQGNGWNNSNWNDVLNSYPHVHGSPVVWKMGSKNFNLYVWPEEDYLKAYHFDGRTFLETPVGSSAPLNAAMMSMPGGILSLSWDGTNTNSGVIWASRPNPNLQDLVGGPFVDTFAGLNQQHFAYRDKDGAIWDSWYNDDNQSWNLQKINLCAAPCNAENGLTTGPQAVTGPFVNTFVGLAQQHFAYRDKDGVIWDSWYNNHNQSWNLQQINTSYCMYSPADHQDLTPNAAPCNAINKIVHGYLQAFDATPGLRGHLTELWNSEDNPNDRVEWFAKDSPPTIADGKVFVAEFPAKPSNSDWNANNAFGRLIMYGLRGD